MGKPTICIGENKGADQRLCFRYSDSTIPLLLKSEISFSVTVQVGLCRTWSETTLLVFPRGGSSVTDECSWLLTHFVMPNIYLRNKETQQTLWVNVSRMCDASLWCNISYYMKAVSKRHITAVKA